MDEQLRARVARARWVRVQAIRSERAQERLGRLRLARARVIVQIREAIVAICRGRATDAVVLAARATHLRDKAEALWLVEDAMIASGPIARGDEDSTDA